jgi:hypothetical protein
MPTFETTCINWEDGKWDTEADDMFAAAEAHALEGWMSGEDEGPQCVTVLARESPGDPWGVVVVVGSEDHAWAAPAPSYIIRGLEISGQLDDAKRRCS